MGIRDGRHHAARGFTLLELLIALSLVSLILVLLFGGLRLGSRSWEALEQHVQRREDLRLVRGFIERALIQAREVTRQMETHRTVLFFGGPGSLELVAPFSDFVGTPGLYLVRLMVDERGGQRGLAMQRWLLHPEVLAGSGGYPPWEPQSAIPPFEIHKDADLGVYGARQLLDGPLEVEFAYFGAVEGERDGAWRDTWVQPEQLPQLVRVRLQRAGEWWPDLIVPLIDI